MDINDHFTVEDIYLLHSAADAKRIAKKLTPHISESWHRKKYNGMQSIQDLRATQCPVFRKKLLDTENLILIHNMEADEELGFGRHGNGRNLQEKNRNAYKLLSENS